MIDEAIGTILQILIFTSIPFLVFIIRKRSTKGFLKYIGLKKSTKKANILAILASLIFAVPILILIQSNADFKEIMTDPDSITGKFRIMGFEMHSVLILLMIALLKTSFTEEILFRGFIAKRLISVLGFQRENLLQAAIFAAIHSALFATITTNIAFLILIFIVPMTGAYISVYLNEKIGNGSIIPGWISHGFANVISYSGGFFDLKRIGNS